MPHPPPRSGAMVPMVTPLLPDRTVDLASLRSLVNHLLDAGAQGLVTLGSSGENALLDATQREQVVSTVVDTANGRTWVAAVVAAMGTADAVQAARRWQDLGVDALLLSAPFGYVLQPDELERHFRTVCASVDIAVLAYDVPTKVQVALPVPMLARLAEEGVLAGIKDSSGNLTSGKARLRRFAEAGLTTFRQFTGNEDCIDAYLLAGGDGCIPGLANVFTPLHRALVDAAGDQAWDRVAEIQRVLIRGYDLYAAPYPEPLNRSAVFFAAVKESLRQRGVIEYAVSSSVFHEPGQDLAPYVRAVLSDVAAESQRILNSPAGTKPGLVAK